MSHHQSSRHHDSRPSALSRVPRRRELPEKGGLLAALGLGGSGTLFALSGQAGPFDTDVVPQYFQRGSVLLDVHAQDWTGWRRPGGSSPEGIETDPARA